MAKQTKDNSSPVWHSLPNVSSAQTLIAVPQRVDGSGPEWNSRGTKRECLIRQLRHGKNLEDNRATYRGPPDLAFLSVLGSAHLRECVCACSAALAASLVKRNGVPGSLSFHVVPWLVLTYDNKSDGHETNLERNVSGAVVCHRPSASETVVTT